MSSIHHLRNFARTRNVLVLIAVIAFLFVIPVIATPARAESAAKTGRHVLTIHDGGEEKGILTDARTIGDALKAANIELAPNDVTEPSADEQLVAPNYEVTIYRARPVIIIDGSNRTKVMTPYHTAKQIADQAQLQLHDEDRIVLENSTDVVGDGAYERMVVTRAIPFTFVFYGKTTTAYTMATTVGEMLKEKKLSVGQNEGVQPGLDTPMTPNMTVDLWREGKQTVTQEEVIAFPTEKVQDASHDLGYKEVKTPGKNGKQMVTYEIVIKNGQEVSRNPVNKVTLEEPTKQVEIVGSKVNLPSGSHEDWMAAAGISSSDYGYVNYIFTRESGWRTTAVSPNGYYGLGQTNLGKLSSACPNWQNDPVCQIQLFNGYAVGRYGSWSGAYSYWQSHGWW